MITSLAPYHNKSTKLNPKLMDSFKSDTNLLDANIPQNIDWLWCLLHHKCPTENIVMDRVSI